MSVTIPIIPAGTTIGTALGSEALSSAFDVSDAGSVDVLLTITAKDTVTEVTFVFLWSDATGAYFDYVLGADNAVYKVPRSISALTPPGAIGVHIEARGAKMKIGVYASAGTPTTSKCGATATVR